MKGLHEQLLRTRDNNKGGLETGKGVGKAGVVGRGGGKGKNSI